jgi:hypothetical protein
MDMLAGRSTGTTAGRWQKELEERGKKVDKQDGRQGRKTGRGQAGWWTCNKADLSLW